MNAECAACGDEFEQRPGGRPRLFCTTCMPAGPENAAVRSRTWRHVNPERVAVHNEARRLRYRERKAEQVWA